MRQSIFIKAQVGETDMFSGYVGSLCLQKRSGFTQFTFDSRTIQFLLKSSSEGQMGLCGGWACFTCKKDRIHLDYLWLSLALQFLLRIRSERWMCQKGGWAWFAYKIGLDPPILRSRRIWGVGGLTLLTKIIWFSYFIFDCQVSCNFH